MTLSPPSASLLPPGDWDVFVSHCHTDETEAAHIAEALTNAGLRVFRAIGAVGPFESISGVVMHALHNSKVLLACYSAEYATRTACQHEFATAYLAGQADGTPLARIVAINLEHSLEHVEPRQLRDTLLPSVPGKPGALPPLIDAVAARVSSVTGTIGQVNDSPPLWRSSFPVYPPASFVGRWRELWWLHSALHPHVGPLTSPPGAPIAVVHGTRGIGKTALAAEYVRRFGNAFPGGIVWRRADDPVSAPSPNDAQRGCLWVLDNAVGDASSVAAMLPADPRTPTLVLTRDARLTVLGTAQALTDLTDDDSALLMAAHGVTPDNSSRSDRAEITTATAGSPELRGRVATLARSLGTDASLDRLHEDSSDLLNPLTAWLRSELASVSDTALDILRVLAAACPITVAILRIADILAVTRDSTRLHEIVTVQSEVTELISRGVLAAPPDAVELSLSSALMLALQRLDNSPRRTEQIRRITLRTLARDPEPVSGPHPPRRNDHSDEEQRAAHHLQTELLHRVSGNPLPLGEGSLREALNSLHTLLDITRTIQGQLHPATIRDSRNHHLDTIATRLINDVLRTTLTRWHVALTAHEDIRPAGVTRIDHERNWAHDEQLRTILTGLHAQVLDIARDLDTITGNQRTPDSANNIGYAAQPPLNRDEYTR